MATKPSTRFSLLWQNKGWKLLALVLGWGVWTLIHDVISYENKMTDVPIVVTVDQPDWAVLDMSPQSVNVVFRGPQEAIWELDRNRLSVDVDIDGPAAQDSTQIALLPNHVRAPRGVRVVSIDPPFMDLTMGRLAQTNVPVNANTTGELPAGFEIESVVYRPATVTLYGPEQRLAAVQAVRTAPIDLGGRVRSFERRVPLLLPAEGWGARVEPTDVVVQFTVVERSATREVNDVEIRTLLGSALPRLVTLWPQRANVVLEGSSETLEAFDTSALLLFVNCDGLSPGAKYQLPVQAVLPSGIRIRRTDPPSVEVELE